MVTRILFDPRRDLTDGTTSSSAVTLEAIPTGVREDGSVVILPSTLSFTVNTAADLVQLAAPAASWAWRLVARQDGVVKQQRTVRFTDVTSIKWADLVDVDPATLGETDGHARQWDATFFQLVELIASATGDLTSLKTRLDAITANAPGAFDTFLELATQLGLDETTVTALTALVAGKEPAGLSDATRVSLSATSVPFLGLLATVSTGAVPTPGKIQPYNASSGALAPTLPALSTMAVGGASVLAVQKATADTSANAVMITTASGDTYDSGSTTLALRAPGELRTLQVVQVGSTKAWKVIDGNTPLSYFDNNFIAAFKPERYGAIGDGVTNSTTAIAAAITAANVVGGTVVLADNANYLITATLPTLANNVTVRGGRSTTITVPASAAVGVFNLGSATNAQIRDFNIIGNGSAKTVDVNAISSAGGSKGCSIVGVNISDWHGNGIEITTSDRLTISNCYVTGVSATGTEAGYGIRLRSVGVESASTHAAIIDGCHTRLTARSGITSVGDFNHADWRTGDYARNYDITITNCTAHTSGQSASGAGIFVNGGVRVVISNCHANDSVNDYGIGLEYSRASTIIGCTARNNLGHGFALYGSDQECSIVDCQASSNGTDGICLDSHPEIVSGDTPIDRAVVANCIVRNSGRHGLYAGLVQGLTINGGSIEGSANTGIYVSGASDVVISGISVSNSTLNGVRLVQSTRVQLNSSNIRGTVGNGVLIEGTTTKLVADVEIADCRIAGFPNGINVADMNSSNTLISDCQITGCTIGVAGSSGAHDVTVQGCRFQNSSSRDIICSGAVDWDVIGNRFIAPTLTSVDFTASGGGTTSSTRIVIQGNYFRSGVAMRISAGLGASILASDWFVIRNNTMGSATALPVYSNMGTVIGITFDGSGSGVPEGVYYGAKGSIFRRTDGGTSTTLYVKESGVGNTGWVAK